MEFIVGKWYKNPGNFDGSEKTFAKFEKLEDKIFYFTEWITNGVYKNEKSRWNYSYPEAYEFINIKEIQEYLPFDHPEKIPENMNYLIQILERHGIK